MTLVVLALDAVFRLTPAETSAALPGIAGLGHMLGPPAVSYTHLRAHET